MIGVLQENAYLFATSTLKSIRFYEALYSMEGGWDGVDHLSSRIFFIPEDAPWEAAVSEHRFVILEPYFTANLSKHVHLPRTKPPRCTERKAEAKFHADPW